MFLYVSVILSTISGGHRKTYGWQAGGTHPTGMLSCFDTSVGERGPFHVTLVLLNIDRLKFLKSNRVFSKKKRLSSNSIDKIDKLDIISRANQSWSSL